MGRKNIPIPHIPLRFEEAVKDFLSVKPESKQPKKPQPLRDDGKRKDPSRNRVRKIKRS